jgi:large subunit ribosomal protein L1
MAEAKAPKTQKKVTSKKQPAKVQPSKVTKAKEVKEAELIVEAVPAKEMPAQTPQTDDSGLETTNAITSVAKAGKRSTKALKETEEKEAKQNRKAEAKTDDKPKETKKPARSRVERAGKKYREVAKLIEAGKVYSLSEALELATKTSTTKFDATVEMHINLGVDPKQADQNVRDTVVLPAGTGKTIRIAVVGDDDEAKAAVVAGADIAGAETVLALLDKEQIDFDVLIATPTQMAKLGKYARLLGPRGLMPNPKSGSVTTDIAKAVTEAKAGKVEYRVDQAGIVHLGIGKVSFGVARLADNANAVISSIKSAKPSSLKGNYIKSAHLSTSMGPSVKFELV